MKRKTIKTIEDIIARIACISKKKHRTIRFEKYCGMKCAEHKWNKTEDNDLAHYQALWHFYVRT